MQSLGEEPPCQGHKSPNESVRQAGDETVETASITAPSFGSARAQTLTQRSAEPAPTPFADNVMRVLKPTTPGGNCAAPRPKPPPRSRESPPPTRARRNETRLPKD